jgi:hypothetical protein
LWDLNVSGQTLRICLNVAGISSRQPATECLQTLEKEDVGNVLQNTITGLLRTGAKFSLMKNQDLLYTLQMGRKECGGRFEKGMLSAMFLDGSLLEEEQLWNGMKIHPKHGASPDSLCFKGGTPKAHIYMLDIL